VYNKYKIVQYVGSTNVYVYKYYDNQLDVLQQILAANVRMKQISEGDAESRNTVVLFRKKYICVWLCFKQNCLIPVPWRLCIKTCRNFLSCGITNIYEKS
jgi:hypothetical protein